MGLFLAFPGLLAILALAPWAIRLSTLPNLPPAVEMLKWFVVGCMDRVLSWPLGFSLLATGKANSSHQPKQFAHGFHVGIVLLLIQRVGLNGAATAFALLYFAHTAGMLAITKLTIDFRWSRAVLIQIAWMTPLALAVFFLRRCFKMPFFVWRVVGSSGQSLRCK